MSNICTTCYAFYSLDYQKIKDIHEKLFKDGSYCNSEEEFYEALVPNSSKKYELRGELTFISDSISHSVGGYYFFFDIDTKWEPSPSSYFDLADELNVYLAFCAEELGNDIFDRFDPTGDIFTEECIILSDCDCEYFSTELEAVNYIIDSFDVDLDKYVNSSYGIMHATAKDKNYSYADSLCKYVDSLASIYGTYNVELIMVDDVDRNYYN